MTNSIWEFQRISASDWRVSSLVTSLRLFFWQKMQVSWGCDLQHPLEWFAAAIKVSTSKSKVAVPWQKMVDCPIRVGSALLPRTKWFKCFRVLFSIEGRMESEINRLTSDGTTPTYGHELQVATGRMRSQLQAAEMSFLPRVSGLIL